MKIRCTQLAVIGAIAVASVTPAAAIAASGNGKGHGHAKQHANSHRNGKTKVHNVTYVFKGTWNAATDTVSVTRGNAHVRKGGLVGQDVQFDLTSARLVVADTSGDGQVTAGDLKDGDKVVVKARLPRKDPGGQPFKAKMLVDQTNPPGPDGP